MGPSSSDYKFSAIHIYTSKHQLRSQSANETISFIMHFSTISPLLITGAIASVYPRGNNTCFDPSKGACMGYNADAAKAVLAITNACNQVTSCTPGQTGHGRRRVSGTFVASDDPKEEETKSPQF
jgi:hypothetical protein